MREISPWLLVALRQLTYDCKGWDEIRVPAHIQMEGYDVPIYTNTTYPWEADEFIKPGEVPEILIRLQAM